MIPLVAHHSDAIRALCRTYGVARLERFGLATTDAFDPATTDIDIDMGAERLLRAGGVRGLAAGGGGGSHALGRSHASACRPPIVSPPLGAAPGTSKAPVLGIRARNRGLVKGLNFTPIAPLVRHVPARSQRRGCADKGRDRPWLFLGRF